MKKRIAVLGGGISGLSAAWNLMRSSGVPVEVTVYEAASRVGGWMASSKTSDGAVFEMGPRSLRTAGPSARVAMELISSIGLEKEVLPVTKSHKAAHRRLIYTQDHGLIEVPSNLSWVLRTKPPFSKPLLGCLMKEIFTKKGSSDETIHDFIQRRFGNEVLRYLVDPVCRGIFASGTKNLSIRSCFPAIYQAEQIYGSVIRGMVRTRKEPLPPSACSLLQRSAAEKWTMYTLREGLGSLPVTLQGYLQEKGVKVQLGLPCSALHFTGDKVTIEGGNQTEQYDHVVSTVPAYALSSLVQDSYPILAQKLNTIASVTVGVLCLEYEGGNVIPQEYREAFGYLVPSSESSNILGVVFDSSTFPEHDRKDKASTRLTVMLGGEWFETLYGSPDKVNEESVVRSALEDLRLHLGITENPDHVLCKIHKDCIAVYEVGHSGKLDFITNYLSEKNLPLTVTGSFFHGVSINDCIYNSVLSTSNLFS